MLEIVLVGILAKASPDLSSKGYGFVLEGAEVLVQAGPGLKLHQVLGQRIRISARLLEGASPRSTRWEVRAVAHPDRQTGGLVGILGPSPVQPAGTDAWFRLALDSVPVEVTPPIPEGLASGARREVLGTFSNPEIGWGEHPRFRLLSLDPPSEEDNAPPAEQADRDEILLIGRIGPDGIGQEFRLSSHGRIDSRPLGEGILGGDQWEEYFTTSPSVLLPFFEQVRRSDLSKAPPVIEAGRVTRWIEWQHDGQSHRYQAGDQTRSSIQGLGEVVVVLGRYLNSRGDWP